MEYEVTEVPASTFAVIKQTVPFADLPKVMPGLLQQVHEWAHAEAPHGLPMCISSMADEGMLNIAPGWEVDGGSADPPAPIELVRTPEQRAAVHLHVGPYEGLPQAYRQLYDALISAGLQPADEPRELYESEPGDPSTTTRIVWPLASS